jgi:hypothetical protein
LIAIRLERDFAACFMAASHTAKNRPAIISRPMSAGIRDLPEVYFFYEPERSPSLYLDIGVRATPQK